MKKSAIIDSSGNYRYLLTRRWDETLPDAAFVMLNPSTADAELDDPTIRRCIEFARSWGYGGIQVVNVFAYRSTDPKTLCSVSDPIGSESNVYIKYAFTAAAIVVAAWGASGPKTPEAYNRVSNIAKESGHVLYCLGLTKSGQPRHPLYLSKTAKPILMVSKLDT